MDMPMKKKRTATAQAAARGPLPELSAELLDHLVKGPMTPSEVQDLMLAFNKAVIERAMGAEMNLHLGYKAGAAKPAAQANERNGANGKTIHTERGPVRVALPRDRDGSFDPILIPKHERRFTGFDERIIAMYARGMRVCPVAAPADQRLVSSPSNPARAPTLGCSPSSRQTNKILTLRKSPFNLCTDNRPRSEYVSNTAAGISATPIPATQHPRIAW